MKHVTSTFGTKRQFLDAGLNAQVSFLDAEGKPVTKPLSQVGPCVVRDGTPVPQAQDVRWGWDHAEKPKGGELTQRQIHSKLQPSWQARFDGVKVH